MLTSIHTPFGMQMPGRGYSAGSGYRYGFNGKEQDSEVKGEGNQEDYGLRIYDPRLGRFLSVDPLSAEYPELTPYQFTSNSPIANIDLDGLERFYYGYTLQDGKTTLTLIKKEDIIEAKTVATTEWRVPRSAMNDGLIQVNKQVTEVNQRQEHIVVGSVERPVEIGPNVVWRLYDAQATYNSFEEAQNFKESDLKLTVSSIVLNYGEKGLWNVAEEIVNKQLSKEQQKQEGVIYERTDQTGNIEKPYVGQAKSKKRYVERQSEHARENPKSKFKFKIIDRGTPGKDLDMKEQKALDARGGPTNKSNPNGGTSNKKNVIRKKAG